MRSQKFKIHQEETKQRYISHWDMDYVPSEERELLMGEARSVPGNVAATGPALLTRIANRFLRNDRKDRGCGCFD